MCLMNGKNHDGGIHPLDISVPLSCASASHSYSAVLFFFLLRAGPPAPAPAMPKIPLNKRAPSACPYFYIYIADEAWQSSCQLRRNLRAIADVILVRVCSTSCSCSARACRLITHSSSTSTFLLYLHLRRCKASNETSRMKRRMMDLE